MNLRRNSRNVVFSMLLGLVTLAGQGSAFADQSNIICGSGTYDIVSGVAMDGSTCTGEITFPEGITSIGLEGFVSASGITKINFPASLLKIEHGAFMAATSLSEINFPSNANLETIEFEAFLNTGLISVAIPNKVSKIEASAFEGTQLESITIGTSVSEIQAGAFWRTNNLRAVVIPSTVTKIGGAAFPEALLAQSNGLTLHLAVGVSYEYNFITCAGDKPISCVIKNSPAFQGGAPSGMSWVLPVNGGDVRVAGAPTTTGTTVSALTSAGTTYSITWVVEASVAYNANGGSGSMSVQTSTAAAALSPNTFTRTGYTFEGWATTSGGIVVNSIQRNFGGIVAYTDRANYSFTSNVTLYAVWGNTVSFNSSGGSYVAPLTFIGTPLTSPTPTPPNPGWIFRGWVDPTPTLIQNWATWTFFTSVTLKARWSVPCGNGVYYTLEGGSAYGGSDCSGDSIINELVIDSNVIEIGTLLNASSTVKKIVIPNTVTSINANAFRNALALQTLSFEPDSHLTAIDNRAFSGTSLDAISIPSSVTTIGKEPFPSYPNLIPVTLNMVIGRQYSYSFLECTDRGSCVNDGDNSDYDSDGVMAPGLRLDTSFGPITGSPMTTGVYNPTFDVLWGDTDTLQTESRFTFIVRDANSRTVTYNLGGGSGSLPTQEDVAEGSSFTTASFSGLSKTGYTFNKWNDGLIDTAASSPYTLGSSNVILTATWAAVTTPPPVVYIPPPPQPYLSVGTAPSIRKVENHAVCSSGTYDYGVTYFDGTPNSLTKNISPAVFLYKFFINGVENKDLAVSSAAATISIPISTLPAAGVLTCHVTVERGGVSIVASSTLNTTGLGAAEALRNGEIEKANVIYQSTLKANADVKKSALIANRKSWRDSVQLAGTVFAASRTAAKSSKEVVAASKIQSLAVTKAAANYKQGIVLIDRDYLNMNLLAENTRNESHKKANSVFASILEANGYGVTLE